MEDFVAAAKAKPRSLNFSSVGIGSAIHLSAERFLASAGIQAAHVPFKASAEAMTEVIAGRMDFFFGPIPLVLLHVQEGKLTALAVNGSKRSQSLLDVPTTLEAGYGVSNLARNICASEDCERVDKLNRETLKALQDPKVRDKLTALGFEPMALTPPQFASLRSKGNHR